MSKEVIRLYTCESIIQFRTPVRPLISRLTPILVCFLFLFFVADLYIHTWFFTYLHTAKKLPSHSHLLSRKHKQTDHTTAQSNSVFGPAGIFISPGDISLTWLTSEDLSERTFRKSKISVSVFHLRSMSVSLNILLWRNPVPFSLIDKKIFHVCGAFIEWSPWVVLPTILLIIYCYFKSRDESGCRNPWLWVKLTFHIMLVLYLG